MGAIAQSDKISPFKAWVLASRPKTLPISFPPIIVAAALAKQEMVNLNGLILVCALLFSLAVQIGTNLINDALDFKKGTDTPERLGFQRMTQGGFLSFKEVLFGGFFCFTLALLFGIPLISVGGWPIFMVLILCVICGYLYTGGPYPLAYTGMSDLFVLIFYGWVGTCVVYYLQTASVSFSCFLAATQIGLFAVVPLAINNLRDIHQDVRANKKSLAVRFGIAFARWEITLCSLLPFVLGLFWFYQGSLFMAFLPFCCLPLVSYNVKAIWVTEPSRLFNEFFARSALSGLFFSLLLALGIILG